MKTDNHESADKIVGSTDGLGEHFARLDVDGCAGKYVLKCLQCGENKLGCGGCSCGCYSFEKCQVSPNAAVKPRRSDV